jgi:hypothetical protein
MTATALTTILDQTSLLKSWLCNHSLC